MIQFLYSLIIPRSVRNWKLLRLGESALVEEGVGNQQSGTVNNKGILHSLAQSILSIPEIFI